METNNFKFIQYQTIQTWEVSHPPDQGCSLFHNTFLRFSSIRQPNKADKSTNGTHAKTLTTVFKTWSSSVASGELITVITERFVKSTMSILLIQL